MYAIEHTKAIVVLWVMTGLSFILVPLRLYTRIYLLNGLGLDDHFFNLGWVRNGSPLAKGEGLG